MQNKTFKALLCECIFTSKSGRIDIPKEIDGVNAKIIKDLLADARKSFVEIAAECNLSPASIAERFSELEKANIIVGSTIQVNHRALGYNAVCTLSVKVDPKEAEQVIAYIKKIPFHVPLVFQDAKHNVTLIVGLKNFNEVGKLKETIRRCKFVLDLQVEHWTDVKNRPENLEIVASQSFSGKEKSNALMDSHSSYALDDVDLKLIEELTTNSLQPFSRIAKEIGTSINTISRKYKKLAENGIIKPIIQVSLPKLGYNAVMLFSLKFASQSDTDSVIQKVTGIKDNTLMIKTSGVNDLFVYVMVKDLNQLLLTQNQVAKIQGILGIDLLVFPAWVPWPGIREYISTF